VKQTVVNGRGDIPLRRAKAGKCARQSSRRRRQAEIAAVLVVAGGVAGFAAIRGSLAKAAPFSVAVGYRTPAGIPVYGSLGPEKVPLEIGPALAPPNAGLSGATIDGIGCTVDEQLTYHHHVHLTMFVGGRPYSLPLGMGMVPPVVTEKTPAGEFALGSEQCLYWTHVHARDGIIHIESPEARDFTLGQVMDIWHVTLTADRLGHFSGDMTATVNGHRWRGDPTLIPLTQHAQIVLNVGGPIIVPPPISWTGTGL
jgi:hypothetical protein